MAAQLISVDTVDQYNKLYGFPTLHPLATVVDMAEAKQWVNHVKWRYGLYALWLKDGKQCTLHYGRKEYDYQDGTIVSFAPGQVVQVDMTEEQIAHPRHTLGLLFHPDLIYGTPLGKAIGNYHFFDYDSAESLHLSERERAMIIDTLKSIHAELELPVDQHSQTILTDRIKLILDYCQRFYDRQFITRHKVNSDILSTFERNIKSYFAEGIAVRKGLPSVAWFADKACLSPGYFGDLIRKETGMNAQVFIQQHVLSLSKERLMDDNKGIGQIADELGFQYPQHFTRFFKKMTGMTPKEYRQK
ncbi:helix-turn-helix domain-containing protein [Prevotella sp. AGR2160]|uniref:helix-turn-helix domain-containing protein n=1 Tax=Prevotella sp. AGR2160 TaxID=1280674 RepID=UPI00040AAB38|nr:helix-turn-helix domain-containing protein [Prevotella sp. AGR2160]